MKKLCYHNLKTPRTAKHIAKMLLPHLMCLVGAEMTAKGHEGLCSSPRSVSCSCFNRIDEWR